MKGSWIVVLGAVAAFAAGCDDDTDGSGGAGTTSSSSTATGTTSTTTTTSTGSSSSTGGTMASACASACTALKDAGADLMCAAGIEAKCNMNCTKDFTDFPACQPELIAYYECLGTEVPMATMCMCDDANMQVLCTGICGAELSAATDCAMPMP